VHPGPRPDRDRDQDEGLDAPLDAVTAWDDTILVR